MTCNLMQGDCLDLMKNVQPKSVDLVVCDLPYGQTSSSWDIIIPFDKLWASYKRICKKECIFLFTAKGQFMVDLILSNLDWYRYEWVWNKKKSASFATAKKRPLNSHEFVLVFSRTPIDAYPTTVIEVNGHSQRGLVHPTQKPVGLMTLLITKYSNRGNLVLDNCMGSGTTGIAALSSGRNFIGMEKDKKYFEIAKKRINAISGLKELF